MDWVARSRHHNGSSLDYRQGKGFGMSRLCTSVFTRTDESSFTECLSMGLSEQLVDGNW